MAVSQKGEAIDVSKAQLFEALAAEVEVDGEVVANPYKNWSEIDPSLPDIPITVYGPPPTSGTRDAWVELVMLEGCAEFPAIEALGEDRMAEVCQRMRTDGPFIEAGENDNLIVQRLTADPNAYGIFGYSFLYENQDQLKAIEIGGVAPNEETIESGEYAVSRPLFIYVKNDHRGVIPNLQEFVEEYVSEDAMGPGGYLSERGLIPLPEEKLKQVQEAAVDGRADGDPELLAAQQANRSIRRAATAPGRPSPRKASDSRNVRGHAHRRHSRAGARRLLAGPQPGAGDGAGATPPGDCTRCRSTTATTSHSGAACRR